LYAFILSPLHATCPACIILLDLIIVIIFGESTSYEALHYAVFSSLLSFIITIPYAYGTRNT
jgi:hypothetical protein